jgi:Spy/CpxP family protein refolding chaperone
MKRWKIITALALVFILGVLTGIVGTGIAFKHGLPFGFRDPEQRKAFIMKRLERKLDLTAAQLVRVAAIVDRRHDQARDQFRRHRQALHAFMAESFAEIRKELTPEQQVKLDAFEAELEARFRKRGRRFPPPPGH